MPVSRASDYLREQAQIRNMVVQQLGIPGEAVDGMNEAQYARARESALGQMNQQTTRINENNQLINREFGYTFDYITSMGDDTYRRVLARAVAMRNQRPAQEPVTMPSAEELRNSPIRTENITFGIEIECYLKNNGDGTAACQRGAYHNGVQIPELPRGWNAQSDASLGHEEGYLAVEIVSPVLKGIAGMDQVREVCEYLKIKQAKVSDRCGFHVHVSLGAHHTTPANINKLVMLAKYWEPALFAITGTTKREEGAYCKSRPDDRVNGVINAPTVPEKSRVDERYRMLNLIPLNTAKKTVEFRLFSGTTLFIKMAAYIQVALGLCEAATGNIAMNSLKMHPTGRLKTELAEHRYVGAVRELIRFLWRIPARPGNSKARGVVDPSIVVKCKDELMRLAKVYQGKKNRAE